MQLTVQLHGVFRADRFKEKVADYPHGTNVRNIVEQLRLPDHILGIILINGIHGHLDSQLKDGDIISLLPMLDGG